MIKIIKCYDPDGYLDETKISDIAEDLQSLTAFTSSKGEVKIDYRGTAQNLLKVGYTKILPEDLSEESAHRADRFRLKDFPTGSTFSLCGYEFVVLEHLIDGGSVVCFKDLVNCSGSFGSTNNYNGSNIDKLCRRIARELADTLGKDKLVEFELDLTSDDGLDDYGIVGREVALMTAEMYRKHVRILDKYKPGRWWWLATPFSTATHGNADWIKCVSPSGAIYGISHLSLNIGVRPFCILESNIFVSMALRG